MHSSASLSGAAQAMDAIDTGESSALRTSEPGWLLTEDGFTLAREHEVESLLAISNGYVGNRASLAEGSPLSAPATFAAGIFTRPARFGAVPHILTLPDWTGVRVWIEGHPLNLQDGNVLEHRRTLDMHHGVLWREWRHRDPNGRETYLVAFRLASLADRHLLLQSVALRAENYSGTIRLESSVELPPEIEPWMPEDWKTRRSAERPNVLPLAFRTPADGKHMLAFAVAGQLLNSRTDNPSREVEIQDRRIVEKFEARAEPGTECHLLRVVSIFTSRDGNELPESAVTHANRVFESGFSAPASSHVSRWRQRWQAADVQVEGDDALQRALRFSAYHLISAANPDDSRVSIGARALTGEAYKGHVFWDTEIYMLPFFTHTHPPAARALLTYRYHTLGTAREKARSAGFRGAMYPWESADTGEETTPKTVISPGGEIIEVLNGEMEIHITADVAFAIWQYWQATEDDDFFRNFGAEIMLETARFWASRGELESDGAYHIRHVIGPDEYHEDVDDNAYTNLMAAWNLRHGAETARLLEARWPNIWHDLSARLHLSDEPAVWARLADAMFTGFNRQTSLFEQFTGYFDKAPVDLKSYEPRSAAMDVILGHSRIQETNVVKQADVAMAMYLLWNDMPADVRVANFRYYEPRTGHGSSLSPAIHALLAARFGEMALARRYLQQASEIDLSNNMGNAAGGVHAAAMGGLWQAVIFGFAGVEPRAECVAFTPSLLSHWRRLSFPFQWRNRLLRVSMEPNSIRVSVSGEKQIKVRFGDGPEMAAEPGREYHMERSASGQNSWILGRQS